MRKILFFGAALGLITLSAPSWSAPQPASSPRQRLRFDANWRFQLDTNPAKVHSNPGQGITAWRLKMAPGLRNFDTDMLPADLESGEWKPSGFGGDVFGGRRGFAWFQTDLGSLTDLPSGAKPVVHFEGVDDNATVFLNGKLLTHHEGYDDPFDVSLETANLTGKPNILTVLVENTGGGGGLLGAVTLENRALSAQNVQEPVPSIAQANYNDKAWRTVQLPHDYVVEGKFTPTADAGHGSLPTPQAWYRKTFFLPKTAKNHSVWIDFDGIYRDADIYLNGQKLGNHPSGYIGARFDISQIARFEGQNVLAVHVDPSKAEGWWYEGGGIYRHVWLNIASKIHAAPWGTFVSASLPDPKAAEKPSLATLTITTEIANDSPSNASVRVVSRILDMGGKVVASGAISATLNANSSTATTQKIAVNHPVLWSIEQPQLYSLQTLIQRDGHTLDETRTPFGIRTLRYDAQTGFYLNGVPVKIKGTCNHQDFAGVGIAIPDSLQTWRIKKLKEMGSNAYRTSHNPPTPELLEACDRLGMLVMDETRHLGDTYRAKSSARTPFSDLSDLKAMVKRDRNHPSVIMWSLCNEEFAVQSTPAGARIFAAMKDEVRKLDATRPVTGALNGSYGQGISREMDIQGYNYNIWGYDSYHKEHPNEPVLAAETSSEVGTRGIYSNDKEKSYVSSYDNQPVPWGNIAQDAWKVIAERPWMMGAFVWTGFDYKGEPTPYGWPCVNSHFGILDMAGFPKDNFYLYQAMWGEKPVVHVLPHWNWNEKLGQPIDVWAYSNAEEVELFLNGQSLGRQKMLPYSHLEWKVNYAPGTLEVRAYKGGEVMARDIVETTQGPFGLRLSSERKTLQNDGQDAEIVTVDVVDSQGRVVPGAHDRVTFKITGAGRNAGVGNGDPSDHDPDQANSRRAFNGHCMAIVQAGEKTGQIRVVATSPGLKSAVLTLNVAAKS